MLLGPIHIGFRSYKMLKLIKIDMEKIIKITAPDGYSIEKNWKCNCSNEEELLEDIVNYHTFLIGYSFEVIKEEWESKGA